MSQDANYFPPNYQAPVKKKSNTLLIVLGIIGGVMVLCCGIGTIGSYFAYQAGSNMMAEVMKSQFEGIPEVQEHLGDLKSVTMSIQATAEVAKDHPGSLVFEAVGSKSNGRIVVKQDQAQMGPNGNATSGAFLILPDGREIPIAMESPMMNVEPEAPKMIESESSN